MPTLRTFLGPGLVVAAALAAGALPSPALAADPAPLSAEDRAALIPLTDGKGHFILALPLRTDGRKGFFYSPDGKILYEQSLTSSGGEVGKRFSYLFVDPRYYTDFVFRASLEFADGKYSLTCGTRTVPLQLVSAPEVKTQLAAATLTPSPRKWKPHALARDQRGNYYYVDQGRTKETEKQLRLFAGPTGGLKQQKMTNIISDSEGEIFSTKSGSLRLLVSKKEYLWIAHEKSNPLTTVPVEDNQAMIYNDLGVYTGQKLGTPCDDM